MYILHYCSSPVVDKVGDWFLPWSKNKSGEISRKYSIQLVTSSPASPHDCVRMVYSTSGMWARHLQKLWHSLPSSVSLTYLCLPVQHISNPKYTRQTQLTISFFGSNWMNGKSNHGSGTIQWGMYLSKATRLILAETVEKPSSTQKPRREGKRKTQALKHYEGWKRPWLRKQTRKRAEWHWWFNVNSANPINHKSPWKTQRLTNCTLKKYTQLQN